MYNTFYLFRSEKSWSDRLIWILDRIHEMTPRFLLLLVVVSSWTFIAALKAIDPVAGKRQLFDILIDEETAKRQAEAAALKKWQAEEALREQRAAQTLKSETDLAIAKRINELAEEKARQEAEDRARREAELAEEKARKEAEAAALEQWKIEEAERVKAELAQEKARQEAEAIALKQLEAEEAERKEAERAKELAEKQTEAENLGKETMAKIQQFTDELKPAPVTVKTNSEANKAAETNKKDKSSNSTADIAAAFGIACALAAVAILVVMKKQKNITIVEERMTYHERANAAFGFIADGDVVRFNQSTAYPASRASTLSFTSCMPPQDNQQHYSVAFKGKLPFQKQGDIVRFDQSLAAYPESRASTLSFTSCVPPRQTQQHYSVAFKGKVPFQTQESVIGV